MFPTETANETKKEAAMTEIHSVSRSTFTLNGKCKHTHTMNFTSAEKAKEYEHASKRIDAIYAKRSKSYAKWEYSSECKAIY